MTTAAMKLSSIAAMAVGGPGQKRDAVWFVAIVYPVAGSGDSILVRVWGKRTSKKQIRSDILPYWKAQTRVQELLQEKAEGGYSYINAADPYYSLRSAVREAHAFLDPWMLGEIDSYNKSFSSNNVPVTTSTAKVVVTKVEKVASFTLMCDDCKNPVPLADRHIGSDNKRRCSACHGIAFPTGALPAIGVFGEWDLEID